MRAVRGGIEREGRGVPVRVHCTGWGQRCPDVEFDVRVPLFVEISESPC
jgi:hypothetical protein